jgi:hypothetical protein
MLNDDAIAGALRRVNRRQLLIGAGAAGAAASLAHAAPVLAGSNNGSWILGAWDLAITVDGNPAPPVPGLVTFGQGGTVSESDGSTPSTTSLGGWRSGDDGRVDTTLRTLFFDPNGNLTAIGTVSSTVHSGNDGRTFHGTYHARQTDPTGQTVLGTASGVVTGTRLPIHGG